jgi:hypothetical protein
MTQKAIHRPNHRGLTHAGRLAGAPLPGLQMGHLVVDLVNHLGVGLQRQQLHLIIRAIVQVGKMIRL